MLVSQSFAVTERCFSAKTFLVVSKRPLQNVYSSVMEERPRVSKVEGDDHKTLMMIVKEAPSYTSVVF